MTITLELTPDMERHLQKAAQTQGMDIAAFLLESAREKLRPDVLSETEARLLQSINAPIDPVTRKQRDALLNLQTQRELTVTERETLTKLIDAVELANAARWQSLAELAAQRGLSLAEIARELEIPLP